MQLSDILNQTGGLQSIARELGIGEDEAASAASALAPAVLGGFRKQAESPPQGLAGLGGLLNQFGGGGLLDAVLAPSPTDTAPGNDVLGQIFGSKDVSRAVAQNAAAQTGQDEKLLKKMLPMLAMLVAGYMAKQRSAAAPASGSAAADWAGCWAACSVAVGRPILRRRTRRIAQHGWSTRPARRDHGKARPAGAKKKGRGLRGPDLLRV